MLSQVAYPLAYYIEDDMKALIETFYKEENLRFLPDDIQAKGVTSLANLDNRQLIYVAQLAVRPTSREKWLESFWACPRPPKPDVGDSFIDQAAHYNYNMALLNLIHENADYLNLNGGHRHMPSLDWRQDKDRVGPSGKKQALGLARIISEMLSGTLAARIVIHFRPRSVEEENEAQVKPSPNYGKPLEPSTVAELVAAYRAIYRYYYTFAEGIKRVKDDYEGPQSTPSYSLEAPDRDRNRQPRHPFLHAMEDACSSGNEQLLNVVHAFASDAHELLQRVPDDQLDAAVDHVYSEHLEVLQAMSSAGVCYSAMLSPSGQCTKPKCPHRHDRDSFKQVSWSKSPNIWPPRAIRMPYLPVSSIPSKSNRIGILLSLRLPRELLFLSGATPSPISDFNPDLQPVKPLWLLPKLRATQPSLSRSSTSPTRSKIPSSMTTSPISSLIMTSLSLTTKPQTMPLLPMISSTYPTAPSSTICPP